MIPIIRFPQLCLFSLAVLHHACGITLQVSTSGGNASSPLLYGLMFEDINHSGDGGIHGQLLQNNGFQGTNPNNSAYSPVGSVKISQDSSTPLSDAIKSSLKVEVSTGTTGNVGFLNYGYNGVPVNKDTYFSSFYVKGKYAGAMTVSLQGTSGTNYGSKVVQVNSNADSFTYYEASFDATASPDGSNSWQLQFDADQVAGNALWFDLVQLFPSTYHGRSNGLRTDIANFMADMSPSFLRFPGGNNLEGSTIETRWKWKDTIGPLKDRPGRQGTWEYPNTDALGLMEYMYWVNDMNIKPVLDVFAGAGLGNAPTATGDALKPYIQEVMDELEFLLGDASTPNGALRAQNGQANPFQIDMVEIGNEDFITNSLCSSYASRFTDTYNAVHAKYPSMRIIASTDNTTCLPSSLPQGVWADKHHYEMPDDFVKFFNEWDNTPRSNDYGIFVDEFACHKRNDGSNLIYPEMQGSIAEAVYMIGVERNSDLVKMAAYAPLLEHQGLSQWTPNQIIFDSSPDSLTGSTSYYVQKLFAAHRGATILPVTADGGFGPLYWVASVATGASPAYFVKIANYGDAAQDVKISIPGAGASGAATLESVSGGPTDANRPHDAKIGIQSQQVEAGSDGYAVTMPAWSAAVLIVPAAGGAAPAGTASAGIPSAGGASTGGSSAGGSSTGGSSTGGSAAGGSSAGGSPGGGSSTGSSSPASGGPTPSDPSAGNTSSTGSQAGNPGRGGYRG